MSFVERGYVSVVKWRYITNEHETSRYLLGASRCPIAGEKTLYCLGLNPSTAKPEMLDPTVNNVEKISIINHYNSWVMLNLYPKWETNPKKLPEDTAEDSEEIEQNIKFIVDELKSNQPCTVWLAFENNILNPKREYLKKTLRTIFEKVAEEKILVNWLYIGKTRKKMPLHPSPQSLNNYKKPLKLKKYDKKGIKELKKKIK